MVLDYGVVLVVSTGRESGVDFRGVNIYPAAAGMRQIPARGWRILSFETA
jgi:hypothetical protein